MDKYSCYPKEDEVAMIRHIVLAVLVLIGLAITLVFSPTTCSEGSRDHVYQRWLNTYREVAVLGREGLNVSMLVEKLSRALVLIDRGRLDEALSIIDEVDRELRVHRGKENYLLLTKHAYKVASILLIGSIPILFYIVFPRLYLEVWFRTRKRWIVRHEPT